LPEILKCNHKDCNGTLELQPDEKGRSLVYICNKCACTFCLTTVKYDCRCPQISRTIPVKLAKRKPSKKTQEEMVEYYKKNAEEDLKLAKEFEGTEPEIDGKDVNHDTSVHYDIGHKPEDE
jgi:hypothetical protein